MPVLKPPKPGEKSSSGEWTVVLKPGETINVEYEE